MSLEASDLLSSSHVHEVDEVCSARYNVLT
jgi:hypothetical protein